MIKKLISTFALLPFLMAAQLPDKTVKKVDKAEEYYEKGEYAKSDEILQKITEEYPWSGRTWDKLAKTRFAIYLQQKEYDKLLGGNMTVTVKDKDGKEKKGGDSLATALMNMLQEVKPSKKAFNSFINSCREGTRCAENAEFCSIYLRMNFIDEATDENVSDSAYNEFALAENAFAKNNYSDAVDHYKKAVAIDSTYFKARLYLGDAYYGNKQYTGAIKYFKEATKIKPNQQEAWK